MADILKVGRKGEVVLPPEVRATLGLNEGDELVLTVDDAAIILKRKAQGFGAYLDTLNRTPTRRDRG